MVGRKELTNKYLAYNSRRQERGTIKGLYMKGA